MPKVTVLASGIELEVPEGESMMAAARALGFYWPTTCDMQARCATCHVIVEAGADHLSPMRAAERDAIIEQLGRKALEQPIRLACQARVHGDLRVRKSGVRRD